jgi:hypothetical protein
MVFTLMYLQLVPQLESRTFDIAIEIKIVDKIPPILQRIVHLHGVQTNVICNTTQDASCLAT